MLENDFFALKLLSICTSRRLSLIDKNMLNGLFLTAKIYLLIVISNPR